MILLRRFGGDVADVTAFALWAQGHDPLIDIQREWSLDDFVKAGAALEFKGIVLAEALSGNKGDGK